nr:immunoglobulin heavy chain junction region [Macaca mulatta]MOW18882.1 immunoglobulin heavy chain junction region [Macaca mulatta]MOW19038.1 immunoglobulin heavy chain junction region [Macaca mulatta]MOW19072.1 immunoglobulin heavy chain junction region [Macaca mulatta]MOW19081.1 immunoglobulin heavy chain junction region [Macaca mulatta]
CARKEDDLDFW